MPRCFYGLLPWHGYRADGFRSVGSLTLGFDSAGPLRIPPTHTRVLESVMVLWESRRFWLRFTFWQQSCGHLIFAGCGSVEAQWHPASLVGRALVYPVEQIWVCSAFSILQTQSPHLSRPLQLGSAYIHHWPLNASFNILLALVCTS